MVNANHSSAGVRHAQEGEHLSLPAQGRRQVQNHSKKHLIMRDIDLELQAFQDLLHAYDTVSRKTIPRVDNPKIVIGLRSGSWF